MGTSASGNVDTPSVDSPPSESSTSSDSAPSVVGAVSTPKTVDTSLYYRPLRPTDAPDPISTSTVATADDRKLTGAAVWLIVLTIFLVITLAIAIVALVLAILYKYRPPATTFVNGTNSGAPVPCPLAIDTVMLWNDVTGSGITYANGQFTCPTAGVYACTGTVRWNAYPGILYLYFYKNGASTIQYGATNASTDTFNWSTSGQILCAAGDTIALYVNQQGTGTTEHVVPITIGITLQP